jgi:Cu2+-exporting ATPase
LGAVLPIARQRRSAVRRVFAFALTYNIAAASLALAGLMNPLLAAVLMPLSSATTVGIVTASLKPRAISSARETKATPLPTAGIEPA